MGPYRTFLAWLMALAGAAFCLSGCAAPARGYRFDPNITAEQRAQVHVAMDRINEIVLPDYEVREIGPDEDADEVWRIEFAPAIWHYEKGWVLGVTCRKHAAKTVTCPDGPYVVRVVSSMDAAGTTNTAEHELLHSLGLNHVAETGSIMSVEATPDEHWTDADTAECQRVGACGAVVARPVHQ